MNTANLQLAVITGEHPFDVPGLHRLFRAMPGIDAYPQDLENFAHDWGQARAAYDVVLFYNMHMDLPTGGQAETVIAGLGGGRQGIVVLHHALLAWPQSPEWSEIVGISDRAFGFHMGQTVPVRVPPTNHPITRGLVDWEMLDETYTMASAGPDSEVLLTVEHPRSMPTLAWTRAYRGSRVFCMQPGHDAAAWAVPGFREALLRGILWAAGRL